MSTARNDITGDSIQSKPSSDLYRDNWDRIFGGKNSSESNNGNSLDEDKAD
jgi:hypothetical protein